MKPSQSYGNTLSSSTTDSVVTLGWEISLRQPSGRNSIRWLLKKRTNGSVRYCQYTSYYSIENGEIILLLIGGNKKTQTADLDKAVSYLQDFKKRSKK
jgi:hypothetical protein